MLCRWDICSNRNINYRSFAPIIALAGVSHTPQCQMWAVWALANLTTVTPEKYCKLVREEGGITLVEEILNQNSEQVETFSKFISVEIGVRLRARWPRWWSGRAACAATSCAGRSSPTSDSSSRAEQEKLYYPPYYYCAASHQKRCKP